MHQELLKSLVRYDSETGKFYWRLRTSDHIKNPPSLKSWNTRYAGNEIKTVDSKGYIFASINGKQYRAHRLAWLYTYGYQPNVIDHLNGVRCDNRIVNLRDTTCQQNHMNQKQSSKNTSGVTGVYRNNARGTWCAQMKFNGKAYHLGSSKSFFDAICLRKSEERKLGFSHDHGVRT